EPSIAGVEDRPDVLEFLLVRRQTRPRDAVDADRILHPLPGCAHQPLLPLRTGNRPARLAVGWREVADVDQPVLRELWIEGDIVQPFAGDDAYGRHARNRIAEASL